MLKEELEQLKNPEIFDVFLENRENPSKELSLKLRNKNNIPHRAISEQVACYQKAKIKLPHLIDKYLLYDKIALEQASSEATAIFKTSLIFGKKIIDLTGGLGIDDIFFSTNFLKVTYCEINEVLTEIFAHNLKQLQIKNIEIVNFDSIEYLKNKKDSSFDWIYIDPSRRDANRRSVDLKYCTPNVFKNMPLFFQKSKNVMIKVAPAYDITEAARKFPNLTEIFVISVDGECKEVLLILKKNVFNAKIKSFAILLNSKSEHKQIISHVLFEKEVNILSEIKSYFYEPDCSIIKSDLVHFLAKDLNLSFINNNSPFLTNSKLLSSFPGRRFKIITLLIYNEKEIKKYLKTNGILKANVARRGFRLSVEEIRRVFKLKDGGDLYLFFTSDLNKQAIMIVTTKIN
ncbi:MAG: SAM-dependent methyltransferase [Ignavibacteriales bacterium CG18_big_fil_WC_8_21_14_2_50_31_20]|nr:MAG: SAM-dependent methyltransferase [Ignavibacteriales bacterium CG18_big_fil_WC_8_21_14_2_50_31_20]